MKNNISKIVMVSLFIVMNVHSMDRCVFNHMPEETVKHIFSYCYDNDTDKIGAISTTLNTVMSLQRVCFKFQQACNSETIGKIFKPYSDDPKNCLLKYSIFKGEKTDISAINEIFYPSKRRIIMGLMLSGAKLTSGVGMLTYSAMKYNDMDVVEFLCNKQQIDLSQKDWNGTPLFFYARTVEMAKLCENNNIKLDTLSSQNPYFPNILWTAVTDHRIPSEMVEFYLDRDISMQERSSDGQSLLHQLARCCYANTDVNNMLNKGKLLLVKQPLLINTFNHEKKTPLDCARDALERQFALFDDTTPAEELINFLKNNGGKKSKELFLPQTIKDEDSNGCFLF